MGIENLAMKKLLTFLLFSFLLSSAFADNTVNIVNVGSTSNAFHIQTYINGDSSAHFDFFTPVLGSGDTYSTGGDGSYTGSTYGGSPETSVHWTATYSDGGTNYSGGTYDEPSGTSTGTFDVMGSVPPPCFTNLTFTINNGDAVYHNYRILDGYFDDVGDLVIPGGQARSITVTVECDKTPCTVRQSPDSGTPIDLNIQPSGGSPYMGSSTPPSPTIITPTTADTPPATPTAPPATYNPTNTGYNPTTGVTNGPDILFTAGATNPATATQQGDSALYDALTKASAQADLNAQSIESAISNGTASVVGAINGATNGTGTNDVRGTNVFVDNWPQGYSNYLSQIGSNGTTANGWLSEIASNTMPGTNSGATNELGFLDYSNQMWTAISQGTNGAAAGIAAQSLLATPLAALQDVVDGIDPSPSLSGDPGHSGNWEMDFCGTHLDFDPVDWCPTAFSLSIGFWTFILCALYLIEVGRMYWKVIQGFSAMQTGGPPDLNFQWEILGSGFGGNLLGVLVGLVMPAVLVGIWILFVSFTVGDLSEVLTNITGFSAVITAFTGTSTGSMAMHVLLNSFPLYLAVHLLLARVVLQFTLAKSFFIAAGAARWVFGK
jgi:hypothetical protein